MWLKFISEVRGKRVPESSTSHGDEESMWDRQEEMQRRSKRYGGARLYVNVRF